MPVGADGDCCVHPKFVLGALSEFADPRVAAVFGRVHEVDRAPSYYHSVLELGLIFCPPAE